MTKRKLIEVPLPLVAIDNRGAREKQPMRHGRPSRLQLWWAQGAHTAARAVLFSELVGDPPSLEDACRDDARGKGLNDNDQLYVDRSITTEYVGLHHRFAKWQAEGASRRSAAARAVGLDVSDKAER